MSEPTKIGPIQVSKEVEQGIGIFAMNRTWAFTVVLCCLIITGGFVFTSRSHADSLASYATKDEVKKALEVERATYTESMKEVKDSLARIEQRLYDLASGKSKEK